MSSHEPPDQDPTRRQDPAGGDPTRRVDPAGPDPTRRMDRPPPPGDSAPTQQQPWEGEAQPRPTGTASEEAGYDELDPDEPPRRRGRLFLLWLFGLVLGFVLAFVVIALATDDDAPVADADAQERIEALEAELEQRDAQISDLEARLTEAEAAAGDRDEDIEQQRQALEEQSEVLAEWQELLAQREADLDDREAALAERERALDEQEDEPGIDLPEIDDETVDGIVDRVLEQIRDWFN